MSRFGLKHFQRQRTVWEESILGYVVFDCDVGKFSLLNLV